MGLLVDSQDGDAGGRRGFSCLIRRKQVDSVYVKSGGAHHQLAKELTVPHLVAIGKLFIFICFVFLFLGLWNIVNPIRFFLIGVGSTIGAGVYILVGTVAREHSGPALTISFLIAGIAAALSAFCYAELASRCPSAGSAYHYTYICIGEG